MWCGTGCEFTKQCPVGQSDVCPQPRIDVVRPLSGPVDGGTEIVVEGSNLATALHQLKGRLMVGNIPCEVTDYQVNHHRERDTLQREEKWDRESVID